MPTLPSSRQPESYYFSSTACAVFLWITLPSIVGYTLPCVSQAKLSVGTKYVGFAIKFHVPIPNTQCSFKFDLDAGSKNLDLMKPKSIRYELV